MTFLLRIMSAAIVLIAINVPIAVAKSNDDKLMNELNVIVDHYADTLNFNGIVLVGRGDEVIFSKGLGYSNFEHKTPITADTSFRLASLTKQFTASAILVLEQQGALKLDEPLSTYLPEMRDSVGDEITIENMMNHASGLVRDIEELSDLGISKRYVKTADIIEMAKHSTLNFEPGSKFSYSNVGFSLLAGVIERVTGQTYKEAVNRLLFAPNGLTQTMHDDLSTIVDGRASGYLDLIAEKANAPYEDKSYVIGAGSIMSSAEDMFRWSRLVFKGDILSTEQKLKLMNPKRGNYSLGWFIDDYEWQENGETKSGHIINHDGGSQGFSSVLSYLDGHDYTVVVLSNIIPNKLNALHEHLSKHLVGKEKPLPKPEKTAQIIDLLAGKGPVAALEYMNELRASGHEALIPGSFYMILVGRGYMDVHRYNMAEKIFSLVAMDRPDWEYGHLFLGLLYGDQGEYNKAYCALSSSLKAAPESSNARSELTKLEGKITSKDCT